MKFSAKKIFFMLGLTTLAAGSFSSCDSVEDDDRFIPVESIKAQRAVLVEEFTGQLCTNCPDGHEAIHNLLEIYPQTVIPVSIHASSLALSEAQGGLKTETGEEYYKAAGSPALPSAVINKNTAPLQVDNWASTIVSIMARETPLQLDLNAGLDADGQNITINVNMDCNQDLVGRLSVWVVENDIVGYQLDHGVNVMDYVHNHVFRAAVNGTWGQEQVLKAFQKSEVTYTQEVMSNWDVNHLYIVAFVYNDAEGVVQAAQCDIIR